MDEPFNSESPIASARGRSASEYFRSYVGYVGRLADAIDPSSVQAIAQEFIDNRDRGGCLYFIGNGGSAATASHFANDIQVGVSLHTEHPFRAVSVGDNLAATTAIANDHGYEHIFATQLRPHLRAEDTLVAMSVSGNSPNILRAVSLAQQRGATTIGCTGFDGGSLKSMVDISFHVPTAPGEYGPVEDLFQMLDHLLYSYLKARGQDGTL